eukprot:gb/GEZN01007623.1/.p1 GENE.gb/GEZN01007623.1/~~gb/GEZN01007623.1/.p1  ORF type:complete len:459 (-),score=107.89 gb/GEZN01007623.1/:111-1487(-)
MGASPSADVKLVLEAASNAKVTNNELVAWLRKHKLLASKEQSYAEWIEGEEAKKVFDVAKLAALYDTEEKVEEEEGKAVVTDTLAIPGSPVAPRKKTPAQIWSAEKKDFIEKITTRFPIEHFQEDELDMSDCEYNDSEIIIITLLLQGNTTLKSLDLSRNPLGEAGQKALVAFFKSNNGFTAVNLSGLKLDTTHSLELINSLATCKDLSELDLSANNLGDAACAPLAKLLQSTKVKSLHIGGCRVGPKGATIIAEGLTASLQELDMNDNGVGDAGATAFSINLSKSPKLRELRLSGPTTLDKDDVREKITDAGATALAKAITENKSLANLNLDRNFITTPGAIELAKALEQNTTIKVLGLEDNSVDAKGIEALKKTRKARKDLLVYLTTAPPPPTAEDDAPPPPPSEEEDVPLPPPKGTRRVSFMAKEHMAPNSAAKATGKTEEFTMRDNPLTPGKAE